MKSIFLNDKFIMLLILINGIVIFISGYSFTPQVSFSLHLVDNIITGAFIIEIFYKFKEFGFKDFFKSAWNIFDLILILISIPTLIIFAFSLETVGISYLLVFRIMRIFKAIRLIKFFPGISSLIEGVGRALKASVFILTGLFIYITVIGTLSFHLFSEASPEYFGTPLKSLYTTFQIFTVEGWNQIPKSITEVNFAYSLKFVYIYFSFILITGIFGLSIVNSIFVDAMVSDNNDTLNKKVESLESKIDILLKRLEE